eukprot:343286-Chlamydomonas_euryale.AAC.4
MSTRVNQIYDARRNAATQRRPAHGSMHIQEEKQWLQHDSGPPPPPRPPIPLSHEKRCPTCRLVLPTMRTPMLPARNISPFNSHPHSLLAVSHLRREKKLSSAPPTPRGKKAPPPLDLVKTEAHLQVSALHNEGKHERGALLPPRHRGFERLLEFGRRRNLPGGKQKCRRASRGGKQKARGRRHCLPGSKQTCAFSCALEGRLCARGTPRFVGVRRLKGASPLFHAACGA